VCSCIPCMYAFYSMWMLKCIRGVQVTLIYGDAVWLRSLTLPSTCWQLAGEYRESDRYGPLSAKDTVCMRVCACVHAYMHACTHTNTHTCHMQNEPEMHSRARARTHTHTHTHMQSATEITRSLALFLYSMPGTRSSPEKECAQIVDLFNP